MLPRLVAESARAKIRAAAQAFLDGRLSVIDTARAVVGPAANDPLIRSYIDYLRYVDAETDDIPLGEAALLWGTEMRQRFADAITYFESAEWRANVSSECALLVGLLDRDPAYAHLIAPTVLYRPVGQAELDLIERLGFRGFPARLPSQPIFYPVVTESYAMQIARDWNTREPDGVGYVTRFSIDTLYISLYEIHQVGGREHLEYWIPAEDLDIFNEHIVGGIEIIHSFSSRS